MEINANNRKLFHSVLYPFLFLFLIWIIKIVEVLSETTFHEYGIFPRDITKLFSGVLLTPLLHSDWQHLFSNTVAFGALSFMLVYFYRPLHFRIFFIIYFLSGLFTWFIGRPNFHIGASGIIYGLVSFLFLSGVIRKHLGLMAVSAITVLSYGSVVWGVFPISHHLSWEGHLGGFLTGIALAYIYRKSGPQKTEYIWKSKDVPEHDEWRLDYKEENNTQIENEIKEETEENPSAEIKINYIYKSNSDSAGLPL